MSNVAEHLERMLGPIGWGWSSDERGDRLPFYVLRFNQVPLPGVVAYATLGLGRHAVESRVSDNWIRLELLILLREDQAEGPFPGILQDVALGSVLSGRPLLRGDVIGPHGPLVPGSAMEALYVTMPVYFADEFATATESGEQVVIAWLVPISVQEANFVGQHGWSAWEDLLVEVDPDLTDISRDSLLL